MHIAARLLSHAENSQVVVSKTVRDLVTGTDLAFRPLGDASLRGVPGAMGALRGEDVRALTDNPARRLTGA